MLLSLLLFLPLIFALVTLLVPKSIVRQASLIMSLSQFAISLEMLKRFDKASAALQMVEQHAWLPQFGISYFVGVDGLSIWLLMLTNFLTPLVILGSWRGIDKHIKAFHASIFALQTAMLGSFLAMDIVLFYMFFELSLVPMYFIVGIWGGTRRIYASLKFFIYTMAGSLFMLAAIVYLLMASKELPGGHMSASLLDLYSMRLPFIVGQFFSPQNLLFFAFAVAFAIKVPMFPFHTWLPDAHVEAPTPGSVILAGVMLKMGSYGFLRFVIPMFPEASHYWGPFFLVLGLVGIVYGALVAMVQPDMKKLVAYSSVSHMGYVMLGLFACNEFGISGSLYQMLNHGISTGALFLLVGMIYERTHSREISSYGGLAKAMPIYTIIFLIVTFSSIAVPLTNGFAGEFLILLGTFEANKVVAVLAVSGVVLGAAYMLWMVKKIFFGGPGPLVSDSHHPLHDLNFREILVLAPFVVMIFWMGLFPNHFLSYSNTSVKYFVEHRDDYELAAVQPHSAKLEGALAKLEGALAKLQPSMSGKAQK